MKMEDPVCANKTQCNQIDTNKYFFLKKKKNKIRQPQSSRDGPQRLS